MAHALRLPSRAARSLLPLLAAASLGQAPVRIAYLHQGLPVGGVESSLINVCRFIDRRRIEPVLVLFGRDAADALLDDALRAGCAVERFDARWRNADWSISWDERQVRRLARYLRSGGFGAAVAFYGGAELGEPVPLGVAAANAAGLPVVVRIEWVAAAPPDSGRDKRAKFPTSKAPFSAVFHSFRLIFGRAIISRNGLDAWMFFPERARAEHSR